MHRVNEALCKELNRIKISLLYFGRSTVDDTWNGTVVSPSFSRLYYVSGGAAEIVSQDGEVLSLTKGRWYLIPSGFSFSFNCPESMEHIYFHLKISSLDGPDMLQSCPRPISLSLPDLSPQEFEEYLDKSDTLSCMFVHHLVERVLFELLRENRIPLKTRNFSPCVKHALKYINANLSLTLSTEEILKHSFASKSTLTKHFRNEIGMSLHEYLFDKIMFEAEQLLRQNELSIGEISEKFKFCDQFYFSRCFKTRYGLSPTEYKKTNII